MKIEKLTENKIRVIVNTEDLKENDIDFNLLMNKSMETQNLFFEIFVTFILELLFIKLQKLQNSSNELKEYMICLLEKSMLFLFTASFFFFGVSRVFDISLGKYFVIVKTSFSSDEENASIKSL